MLTLSVFVLALALQKPPPATPVVDGKIGDEEWAGATKADLVGDGEVRVLQRDGMIYLAVRGPRAGLASVCAFKGDTVRILHASAATGEAQFTRTADGWTRTAGFEWRLRDSPRTGGPTVAQYDEMVREIGWTANPSASGSPDREFRIRADAVDALAVTFLTTSEPMALSYWPATIADDCRNNVRVSQGFLPATASFDPAGWFRIQTRSP